MSVSKIQKQSPWRVLWKGVSKNYPKFTGSYRLESWNFIKQTLTRAYFRHLLLAVPAHNALFQFLRAFSHSRNLELAWCLGGFFFKFALFYSYRTHALPFSNMPCRHRRFLENFAKLQTAAPEKTFLHMFFQLKVPLFTNNFTQVMFS